MSNRITLPICSAARSKSCAFQFNAKQDWIVGRFLIEEQVIANRLVLDAKDLAKFAAIQTKHKHALARLGHETRGFSLFIDACPARQKRLAQQLVERHATTPSRKR